MILSDTDGRILFRTGKPFGSPGGTVAGYGQRGDVAQALGAGFDLHLTKPAALDDLSRALTPA